MALKAGARSMEAVACSTSTSTSSRFSRALRPAAASSSRSSRRQPLVVRAAASDNSSVPAPRAPVVLAWPEDKETARDIFAFAGSLPERLNGRMAMLGFAGVALAELKDKVPAAEQLAGDIGGVVLLSLTFTMASILPKFLTGYSLKELHASATGANMKGEGVAQALALFDTNTELWTGRIAMLGLTGLFVVEAVTGKVFF